MTIDEFRTKSAQGGFDTSSMSDSEVFLSPKSFQAVGKTEGWNSARSAGETFDQKQYHVTFDMHSWEFQWFCLIDALAEASQKPNFDMRKTIEQFLSTL